jgi:putrescine aminotransferase
VIQDSDAVAAPEPTRAALPVRSDEVLGGLGSRTLELELAHGNRDLYAILDLFGVGGTLRPVSPWEVEDETGRRLIHAGAYAANPFGDGYEPMVAFVRRFLDAQVTVGFPQATASPWRAALQANLVSLLAAAAPSHADSHVLFSSSGAEAIETAMKAARAARPKATTFVNFTRGYHGKTFGALSITPNDSFQSIFRPLLGPIRTVPYGDIDALGFAIREIGPHKVTAIVLEPIQGEAGVVRPPEGYLRAVGELARSHDILVIVDEIQTGLGRTGHWFASTAAGLEPDMVALAKPLGGGIVPVGATILRRELFDAMLKGTNCKRHSTTFGGGSLAMAVALKSLEIIHDEGLVEKAHEDGIYGRERLQAVLEAHPQFFESMRAVGLLFGVQLRPVMPSKLIPFDPELVPILTSSLFLRAMHRQGVHTSYVQNALRVVRMTPPLTIPRELLSAMFDRVAEAAAGFGKPWRMLTSIPPRSLARLARIAL